MKVLAEIPPPPSPPPRPGTLRRRDLKAFGELLGALDGVRTVVTIGEPSCRRATAVGLAAAAAAAGTRTALLECDLADPALAEGLGLAAAPGLREYLRGEADAARILKPVALAGPGSAAAVEPLVCIVAGRSGGDGAALLHLESFGRAAAGLRRAYELVVVDGPPPGDDGAMAAVVGQADATLLCVDGTGEIPRPPVAVSGVVIQAGSPQG